MEQSITPLLLECELFHRLRKFHLFMDPRDGRLDVIWHDSVVCTVFLGGSGDAGLDWPSRECLDWSGVGDSVSWVLDEVNLFNAERVKEMRKVG